jgi:hypothetical protein
MKKDNQNLPDFIIIGAAKSGTTTLYDHLQSHPDIVMSTPKEPMFFSRDEIFDRGLDWYSDLFGKVENHQICGEATTQYTIFPYTPTAAKRISEHLPQVKLIYIMRHPVERLYSHYVYEVILAQREHGAQHDIGAIPLDADGFFEKLPGSWKTWRFAPTFEKSLDAEPDLYIKTGRYIDNVREYLKYFPREALLCVLLEDLINQPAKTMQEIHSFLGVTPTPLQETIASNTARENRTAAVRVGIRSKLLRFTGGPDAGLHRILSAVPESVKRQLYSILSKSPLGRRTASDVKAKGSLGKLSPEMRAQLLLQFTDSNQELGEFLGRDLSHWNS